MPITAGLDLTRIERVENAAQNARFLRRVFTASELKDKRIPLPEKFSAKEACVKALAGAPEAVASISWKDIEVVPTKDGAPSLKLYRAAKQLLGKRKAFLSMARAKGVVAAFVVVE